MKNIWSILLLLSFLLFLSGCGNSTNNSSTVPNPTISTSSPATENIIASLKFEDANPVFLPGQSIKIIVSNIKLTEKTYTAFYNNYGESYAVTNANNSLLLLLPNLAVGSHIVTLTINNSRYDLPFTIKASTPIPQAKAYTTSFISTIDKNLQNLASEYSNNSEVQQQIQKLRQQLAQYFATLSSLSAKDIDYLARIIQSNLDVNTLAIPTTQGRGLASKISSDCAANQSWLDRNEILINRLAASVAIGAVIAELFPVSAPPLLIAGGIAAGVYYALGPTMLKKKQQIEQECLELTSTDLIDFSDITNELSPRPSRAAKNANLNFDDNMTKTYALQGTYKIPDKIVMGFKNIYNSMLKVKLLIPQSWLNDLANLITTKTKLLDNTEGFKVGAISSSSITGIASAANQQVLLTFWFKNAVKPVEAVPFSFNLINPEDSQLTKSYQATLNPMNSGRWTYNNQNDTATSASASDYYGNLRIVLQGENSFLWIDVGREHYAGAGTYSLDDYPCGVNAICTGSANISTNSTPYGTYTFMDKSSGGSITITQDNKDFITGTFTFNAIYYIVSADGKSTTVTGQQKVSGSFNIKKT